MIGTIITISIITTVLTSIAIIVTTICMFSIITTIIAVFFGFEQFRYGV